MARYLGGAFVGSLLMVCGCASAPVEYVSHPQQAIPALHGSYHRVRRGETLWRIAQSYGLEVGAVASANRLSSASELSAGQQLFIPLPQETDRFLWPVRGSVKASGAGIDIATASGNLVRAARGGRVAVAASRVSGWGRVVILDHPDGHLTVYAGLGQLLVSPGAAVRQGMPVGEAGPRPVHFEVRHGVSVRSALVLLPKE